MAWEPRSRGIYYYEGKRHGNQIRKEYLGCGIAAALLAATLLKQKEHRNALWKKRRDLLHGLRVTNRLIRSFFRFSWQFERFLRFIERDAREGILQRLSQKRECSTSMIQATVISMLPDIDKTLARAKQGGSEALPQLIAQKPALKQHVIDLAHQAQENQLQALAGEDQQLKAAILSQFNALKNELGDGSSNILEQLLIERILISWLQAQHTDLLLAKTPAHDSRFTKLLLKRAEQCQGRLSRALTQLQSMRNPQPAKRKPRKQKNPVSAKKEPK